jgi:hypothetical protein
MFALPPKADIRQRGWRVRSVPIADIGIAGEQVTNIDEWHVPLT